MCRGGSFSGSTLPPAVEVFAIYGVGYSTPRTYEFPTVAGDLPPIRLFKSTFPPPRYQESYAGIVA